MRGIAETHGVSVAQIALAWLLHQKVVSSVVVGAKRMDQLEDNLGAANVSLTDEEQAAIAEISKIPAEYPSWMVELWSHSRRTQLENSRR
jgi:aryl-alcohol dehydrogenase-like predicted oxidoreductase